MAWPGAYLRGNRFRRPVSEAHIHDADLQNCLEGQRFSV